MEHVVFYPSADGSPAFRRVGSLDEAVNFVEHLRNVEGVADFSVHALTSVPLSFRAYYHVEVPADGSEPGAPAETAVAEVAPVEAGPIEAVPVEAVPDVVVPAQALDTPVAEVLAPVEAAPPAPPAPPAPVEVEVAAPAEAAGSPFAPAPEVTHSAPVEPAYAAPVAELAPVEVAPVAEEPPAGPPAEAPAAESHPVVDPSVEEVVPVPSGRRSMGFFARS